VRITWVELSVLGAQVRKSSAKPLSRGLLSKRLRVNKLVIVKRGVPVSNLGYR
jgi:hypothetical protein